MVPNLANIAKNHCFPKKLPPFHTKFLPFFEIPIDSIGRRIYFGSFIKLLPKAFN